MGNLHQQYKQTSRNNGRCACLVYVKTWYHQNL